MPEVHYSTTLTLPPEAVWEFVKDMNNWAPFLTGYQTHEVVNEADSIWTLKGDVGILSRVVRLQAHVTEWAGPERVAFTLTGLNEHVEGGGTLVMRSCDAAPPTAITIAPVGWARRLFDALFRFVFRRLHGSPARDPSTAARGKALSELTFTLRMDAGGPTGPLVNAMLGPALLPAAEDLATKIATHLERAHATM